MTDDREREAGSGAARSRSGPPSVPTRIAVPGPVEPPRRGAVAPTMVPLARKRALRHGLRPAGAAATTEPMRDLVGAAAGAGTAPPATAAPPRAVPPTAPPPTAPPPTAPPPTAPPPRGPARSAVGPPRPAVPTAPAAPASPSTPAAPPEPPHPEPDEDREPTERMPHPSAPTPAAAPGGDEVPALRSVVVPASGEADLDWAATSAELSRERLRRTKPPRDTAPRNDAPREKPVREKPVREKPPREKTPREKPVREKPAVAAPVREARPRRRWTWGRTVRVLATAMSALVVLVSGLAWGATSWFETAVRQIAALDPTSASIVDPAAQAGDQNFLVVGSDTRVGATPTEDVGDPNDVPGARSDTVMIVHIPASRTGMTVVSFPRDLEIDRPACERWDSVSGAYTPQTIPDTPRVKLNSAYQVGGPRCVTKVVQQLSGLAVNHFLAVDFSGFKDMVDAVGGVPVCLDKPMRDTILGTVIPRAGTTVITGDQALDFVRARHVIGDPTSDYGRIHRQQLFLSALLRQSLSAGTLLDLGKLDALVGAVSRSTYGENIEADQMLSLGQSLSALDAHQVTFTTVPTTGVANDRGNEVLRDADDRALFGAIIDDRPLPGQPGAAPPRAAAPAVPADRVALRLVDARTDTGDAGSGSGSGDDGSGESDASASGFRSDRGSQAPSESSVAGALRGYGFTVAGGSALSSGSAAPRTVIRFTPDQAGAAATLQRAVPGAALTPEAGGSGGLVLQLGDDFQGKVVNPAAPPPAAPAAPLVNAADTACG
ncbi:LCP family protein [Actinomycetospora sp. TBRC 11914]|uniref:LCP family protein n=1 Tax=Actinomycetospora sp. TBRC 11914 TaxID=2729387 RepID=UPI00145E827E|nr:LCP family protein [Actinomycetospora sp. TBRC 11914]NMO93693.1 LytR family transcriptional regulator [Actinomycetospora sp. TBRC 11914]